MWFSAWASASSSSELECSAVRLAAIPYRVSPRFSSIDAGMYVRAAALHRRSPPLSAVLPSEGGRCAVADAPLPRRPRLCPSWRRLRPPPRCYYDRSLCFFWLFVLCVSQPKMSCGVVLYGHRKYWRNSSSHFPGLCRLVLTCSHDSLFLRYPAIDIVWRGPVFLALGFLRHLALRGSAWWSPGPGWCSHQSFSRTSVLPFLTLTHPLTVTILLLWYRLWHQTPMVSLFLSCVCVPSASTPLLLHIPPSGSTIEIVLFKYSGNRIIGNVIFKLK